ncbi:CHASE3 domain-containing protein [Cytobacillus purgationiresistens]|uniref:Transcriptional regulator of heat shock response n=1 Tax=Cytobacillus purgationiresistens TaxID=863449 RepID=A0ABU0AAQ7_9BACI|nr:hypothetical protein [Cytobacillus purgationiresistens]MDQ0268332.1 transcriptional regulator of heat shock response [Cytobacillus purgationiresistens]
MNKLNDLDEKMNRTVFKDIKFEANHKEKVFEGIKKKKSTYKFPSLRYVLASTFSVAVTISVLIIFLNIYDFNLTSIQNEQVDHSNNATDHDINEVTNLLNSYLHALETNDVSLLVEYSNDIRFPNKDEQKEQYLSIEQQISDTKIVELNRVNEIKFEATIELVDDGDMSELKLPIEKQKSNEWIIIVGQDL